MKGRCIILAGGPSRCGGVPLTVLPGDYVIACDSGYLLAQERGLLPDLVVGDFDSYGGEIDPRIPVQEVSARKNDTDTLLGLRKGLKRGFRDFFILGGFGGRLDHTVANLQSLAFLCEQGARGQIHTDENHAWAVRNGDVTLKKLPGCHLSGFAWGGPAYGVTLSGVSYPLEEHTLTPGFPLGVSNEFAGDTACISVREGTLLIVASREGV